MTTPFMSQGPLDSRMASEGPGKALIALENSISSGRARSILKQMGWECVVCGDGDRAVDEYVRAKPDMVLLGLELSTLNGHIAALEIRESDSKARIVFVASRTKLPKARDAAYSAGAVAALVAPLTRRSFEDNWEAIMGNIPPAPGLADLDELYPELRPELPPLPELPEIPNPPPQHSPQPPPPEPEPEPRKRGNGMLLLKTLVLLVVAGTGVAFFFGVI